MKKNKKELRLEANLENVRKGLVFIEDALRCVDCPEKVAADICLAAEELMVNVANYAYPDGDGWLLLRLSFPEQSVVTIELVDGGIPYDPTAKKDPDISLPLKKRSIGGLGIFMAKQIMDEMAYDYIDGQNHVVVKKRWR